MISVQVILMPAQCEEEAQPILAVPPGKLTAKYIEDMLPTPQAVLDSTAYFRELGFEVGPVEGNSFAVTGSKEMFAKHFGRAIGLTIDRQMLPETIRRHVQNIVQSEKPEFGPGNF